MQTVLFHKPEPENIHKPLHWIEKNIHFPVQSGPLLANQPVGKHILEFQRDIIRTALTPGGRINKDVFLGWTRKVSKSMTLGWIIAYLLEHTAKQMVVMSSTYSQANNFFQSVVNSIMYSPLLSSNYKFRRDSLTHKTNQSRITKIFNSASANLGMQDIQVLICDELSAFNDRENFDAIKTGMSLGEKPLFLYTSNPPQDDTHWSVPFVKELQTDTKIFDFSAPPTAKITDESTWALSNPFVKAYLDSGKQNKIYRPVYEFYKAESLKAVQSKNQS